MRHKVYGKKLGRTNQQRQSLFKSLVSSLFLHESIQTTEAKAKAVKGLVDKIINQAKSPTTRRLVSQFLADEKIKNKLIKELAPRLKTRNSGYTSIIKMGRRLGDNSMIVRMSLLLEEPRVMSQESSKKTVKSAGARKGKAKS